MDNITFEDKVAINTNANIPDINKVTDGDVNEIKSVVNSNANSCGNLSDLKTSDKSSIINAINSILPVTLYDNSTGSNAEITLADSTENYSYIEIYYTDNQKAYANSFKIDSPNGKSIALSEIATGISHSRFERLCNYDISTNKISPTYYFYYVIGTNGTISGINYNTNYIYITKVLGYK